MKSIKQFQIMVPVLLLFATACTQSLTKQAYIQNYQTWIACLKQDYKNYKKADWSRAEATFQRYSETEYNRFNDDLNPEERQTIDKLTGQYYAVLVKHKAGKVKDELNSFINKAKVMFEELKKE